MWLPPLPGDLGILLGLGLALTALLISVALLPPTEDVFSVAHPPAHVTLSNFYGVEQNPSGAYRWSKPDAALSISVRAATGYRVTLTLQESPVVQSPRPVTVFINGHDAGTVYLDSVARDYTFTHRDATPAWRPGAQPRLQVGLHTTPFTPPSEARALGVLVTRVAVTPVTPTTPWQPALLIPNLLLLCAAYGLQRALRLPRWAAASGLALALTAFALLTVAAREQALSLAYYPGAYPAWCLAVLLGLVALALVARVWSARVAGRVLLASLPTLQLILLVWLVWTHSLDVPSQDEWATVKLVQHAREGTLRWSDFWGFHNEHRIVIPRVINLLLIELTDWDRRIELLFNVAVVVATAGLLLWCARRTVGSTGATIGLVAPVSLLLCSFSQFENWLQPFQLTFWATTFGVAGCMWALTARPLNRRMFAAAILGALIASLSSLAGLTVWLAFFPYVWRVGRRHALVWSASALAIIVPYLAGFPGRGTTLASPPELVGYALAYLGAPLGYPDVVRAQIAGLLSIVLAALNLLVYRCSRRDLRGLGIWVGLALFALACAAMTSLGRAGGGLSPALSSRYHTFAVLWWVAILVLVWLAAGTVLDRVRVAGARRLPSWQRGAVLLNVLALPLCAVSFLQVNITSFDAARRSQADARQHQACVRDYATAPDSCFANYFPLPAVARVRTAYLARERLALFRAGPAPASPPATPRDTPAATLDLAQLRPMPMTTLYSVDGAGGPLTTLAIQGRPGQLVVTRGAPSTISGWAIDAAGAAPAGQVLVTVDDQLQLWASYGSERADVAELFGKDYLRSGFRIEIPVDRLAPGRHVARLTIVTRDLRGYYQPPQSIEIEVR